MSIALLLAAGKSQRFKGEKLFELLNGKEVFLRSLEFLQQSSLVDGIFIAVNKKNEKKIQTLIERGNFSKVKKIFHGGSIRFMSVQKFFSEVPSSMVKKSDYLIIHNAANPLVSEKELTRCFSALKKNVVGVAVGRKMNSSLKKYEKNMTRTISRANVWEVETPQVVRIKDFIAALHLAKKNKKTDFTDDLSVLETAGFKTVLVHASSRNRKITTPEDIQMLKIFAGDAPQNFSVGIGEDSHAFRKKGEGLILGGVKIKNVPPLEADSDGDVIIHALCNALASALGKGSLGTYATKMCRKGVRDSSQYFSYIFKKMTTQKYRLHHCAISLEAARPAIEPLISELKRNLSRLLKIQQKRIGITATSGEKLTSFGKGKAIKCLAIILLVK